MFLSQNQTTVYGNCDNEKKVSTENFNSHSLNLLQCAQNNGSKSRLMHFLLSFISSFTFKPLFVFIGANFCLRKYLLWRNQGLYNKNN